MYRLIPMSLRRTTGVKFDEMVPSDIPVIHGIDRVIHAIPIVFHQVQWKIVHLR